MKRILRSLHTLSVVVLLLAQIAPAAALPAAPTNPMVAVRLSPTAFATAARSMNLAGNIGVDYGSFVWLEMPQTSLTTLTAQGIAYEVAETTIGVYGYKFDPARGGAPEVPATLRAMAPASAPGLHLVQFAGPIKDEWLSQLTNAGLRPLQYYAHNAYLVWGSVNQTEAFAQQAFVRWVGPFQPAYKLNPTLNQFTAGRIENLAITFYNDGALEAAFQSLARLGGHYVQHFAAQPDGAFYTVIVSLDVEQLTAVAHLPTVWAIDYAAPRPGFDDEISTQILADNISAGTPITGYYNWLATKGVNGNGVVWADVDTGLDASHPDITGRAMAFLSYPGAGAANVDPDGHGTHTAGAIFGDGRGGTGLTDVSGFYYGTGMAVSSTLIVQNALIGSSWPPAGGWQVLSRDSITATAIGSSNSWFTGATGAQGYSSAARTHDLMVRDGNFDTVSTAEPIAMVFSAGNAGPTASSITEPKEAKNLITVGAARNFPRAGASINDLGSFSSRGPALDGRLLPNVTAPGENTASFRSTTSGAVSCATAIAGTSGRYALCTGTSMAAPLVSGSAALIVEWWRGTHSGATPSPAMIKALLINGASDMVGGANVSGNIPNNNQGWGRVNVNNVISTGVASQYYDQATLFTATGNSFNLPPLIRADNTKPVRISLVWSDAAGGVGASPALVNDLDLTVVNGADTYRGNVFSGGVSATGGSADTLNNIENVYLTAPSGSLQVTVNATNIAGDGVPYNGDATDQDFALVLYNVIPSGNYGYISGTVQNTLSQPLNGALVQATLNPTTTFSALTDSNGVYSMTASTGTYTVTASIAFYASSTVTGVAVISGSTTLQDFTLTALPNADVSIAKSDTPDPVGVGGLLTYTLSIANAGPDPVPSTVTVTDNLPASVVFGGVAGSGWTCGGTSTIVCTLPSLSVGAAPDIVITVTAPITPMTLLNTASITSTFLDTNSANNTTTSSTTVQPVADLSIAKTGPAAVSPGGTLVYTLTVVNTGPSQTGSLTTTVANTASISTGDGGAGTPYPSIITMPEAGPVQNAIVTLTGFAHTWPEDVDVLLVGPGGDQTLLMSDITRDNDVSALTFVFDDAASLMPCTDITLTGGAYHPTDCAGFFGDDTFPGPAPAGPYSATLAALNGAGSGGDWELYIRDDAGQDTGSFSGGWSLSLHTGLGSVMVTDTLPSGATFVGAAGAGWVCNEAGGVVTCTNATFTQGTAPDIVITATAPITVGVITNTAVVGSGLTDPNVADNSASWVTAVGTPTYGVQLAPATQALTTPSGSMVTYTLTVTNTGNVADTYTVTVSGYTYTTTAPASVSVGAGISTTFNVVVTAGAIGSDTATITLTSQGDGATSANASVTTSAQAIEYRLYLPIIRR